MSYLAVPNIICFQTQKQLATLNNMPVLIKSVLIDLRVRNFVHAKISLRAHYMHTRHHARNLLSFVNGTQILHSRLASEFLYPIRVLILIV